MCFFIQVLKRPYIINSIRVNGGGYLFFIMAQKEGYLCFDSADFLKKLHTMIHKSLICWGGGGGEAHFYMGRKGDTSLFITAKRSITLIFILILAPCSPMLVNNVCSLI